MRFVECFAFISPVSATVSVAAPNHRRCVFKLSRVTTRANFSTLTENERLTQNLAASYHRRRRERESRDNGSKLAFEGSH
jgi:hypothetical protein